MTDVARLHRYFRPDRYEILINPNKPKMVFSGFVKIRGLVVDKQKILRLHAKELQIDSVKINTRPAKFRLLKKSDELQIRLPAKYSTGELVADIRFKGDITKPMHGLYPCTSANGEVFLATQLESHHAREIFPCIDEPAAKAVFSLSLTVPKDEIALSNTMPLAKTANNDRLVRFKDTPLMSTYLLAFAIGKFRSRQIKTKDGVLIRVWASADQINHTGYCLEVAKKSLEFFNNYFKVPYPLAKLDLVALPDFAAGAMENWGLITFREACMLVDKQNTSLDTKQFVATTVAHEIAHQWFGNLVTMRWWNDLWLNEGFASWVEYLAVDSIHPEWHMWTQFLVSEQLTALRLDALKNTHAIEVKVPHPDEIRTIFDNISYAKGACMINMLHEYLGDKAFRAGLIAYIKKFAYANSTTEDLWDSLKLTSGLPVKQFMSAWTSQPGFPLVEVKRLGSQLRLKQSRFSYGLTQATNPPIWPIPLLTPALNETMLDKVKIFADKPKNLDKFKLNVGQSGFYITKYWPKQYNRLGELVARGDLAEKDRLSLLSDMLALTKTANLPLIRLVKVLMNYTADTSTPVWDSIAIAISDIRRVMGPEVREAIKPLVNNLTALQVKRLGWVEKSSEPYFDKLLRPLVLSLADGADNQAVIDEALNRFNSATKIEDITKDLRGMIFGSVSRRGSAVEFDKMLAMLRSTTSPEDKIILAGALTNFRQPAQYHQALKLIKSEDVRLQDAMYWLIYSLANPVARDSAWIWVKQNWRWLKENLGDDISYSRLPVYVASHYSDKEFLKTYHAFFKKVAEPSLARSTRQGIETIKLQADWRQRDAADLLSWLKNL